MSDQDMLDTMPLVNDQVSHTPPEPETETESSRAAVERQNEEAVPAQAGQADVMLGQTDAGQEADAMPGQEDVGQEADVMPGQADAGQGADAMPGQADAGQEADVMPSQTDVGRGADAMPGQTDAGQKPDALREPPLPGPDEAPRADSARQEGHAQTGYSYGQPGYGPGYAREPQGNSWGPGGFDGAGRQGTPPPPPPGHPYHNGMPQQKKNNNTMAIASLVLGIMSVLFCCCGGFGIILGAIGIVLAVLSRGREPMETSAKAGIGLSIGGIVLGIIVLVMALAIVGNSELRSDLYQGGYGNYDDYEDFKHYFEHNGM